MKFYSDIIDKYDTYHFYLVAHAGEDLKLCRVIKEKYLDLDRVVIVNHVMPSFNYELFIRKMNFIIASRYHAIVHAYKEAVPAVVLGWADKYQSIVNAVGQGKYLIDLGCYGKAVSAIDEMAANYNEESVCIKERVLELQKENCYEFLKHIRGNC